MQPIAARVFSMPLLERSTLVSKKNRLIIGLTLLIIVLVAVAAIVVPHSARCPQTHPRWERTTAK